MNEKNHGHEEKVLVIDIKLTKWLVVTLVGVLTIALLLTYLALPGENALAVGETTVRAQSGGMRQFYLGGGGSGNSVSTSCAAGYHMASLWEIADPSNLKYNTTLGITQSDTGEGPPTSMIGFVRTGYTSNGSTTAGRANCLGWTSGSVAHDGTTAQLPDNWTSGSQNIGVWQVSVMDCIPGARVWCIED